MTDIRELAERIVDDLLTSGGEKAADLVLRSADGRELGFWPRGSLVDRVEAELWLVSQGRR